MYFITLILMVLQIFSSNISAKHIPSLGDTAPGSVWPQPQKLISSSQLYSIEFNSFNFFLTPQSSTCDILIESFKRYGEIISKRGSYLDLKFKLKDEVTIKQLEVNLLQPCEKFPFLGMNESYELVVKNTATLTSYSIWGILRGLETFSQLLWERNGEIVINATTIIDYPRHAHRGLLLDTSRHYLPISVILANLDAMAYDKYNVFHWHIVDDPSFPYVSQSYPDLSEKGSFTPLTHIYTPEDVAEVIRYARLRGIRVIPEFDTPGHTQSWGLGQPGLLTPCYKDGKADGTFGPINPILNSSYTFMSGLIQELRNVFRDEYIHLGGDEVSFTCWKSNPDITNFMKEMNITGNYDKLEEIYIQKLLNITKDIGFSYLVWQEVFDNGVVIKDDTVVEVWKTKPDPQIELANVTAKGYRALISTPWYLNRISTGEDWISYYTYEPSNFNGTKEQKELVIGGEACMWGEWVDETNLMPRLWPRASAVAERLWSAMEVNSVTEATPRLHQHRCNLILRGIPAEPMHLGFCVHEWRGE